MVEFVKTTGSAFAFEGPFYCIHHDHILLQKGRSQGAHIISADLFNEIGGIPLMDMGEDVEFNRLVHQRLGQEPPTNPEAPQFVYRWAGTERPHISGLGQDKSGKRRGYDVMLDRALELVRLGKEPKGEVHLQPHWSKDWVQEVKKAITR